MNDRSQMMNQAPLMNITQPQLINQPQVIAQAQVLHQPQVIAQAQVLHQPQMMNQPQLMSQSKILAQPHLMVQSQAINPLPHIPQPQLLNQSQMMMHQSQPMLNPGYKRWQRPLPTVDATTIKYPNSLNPNFVNQNQLNVGRNNANWKGKKLRRPEKHVPSSSIIGPSNTGGYIPPTLHELQSQNRLKARKFYPKKKYNNRFAPYAPRNTTSFLIRAKKAGGIASLVSPSPVTPAVLPTPIFSPSREVLVDMAKEEWGVDGYGSMKGLIRLRSHGNEAELHEEEEEEEEEGGGSSESDVEEHVEMERRLDHDLSRFEMIYPSYGSEHNNILENRVDDQDSHIAQLEEENLTLKERLFLMERELCDLRRRMQLLERHSQTIEYVNEEVVENESENESDGALDASEMGGDNDIEMGENEHENVHSRNVDVDSKRNYFKTTENENSGDIGMEIGLSNRRNADDKKFDEEKVIKESGLSSGLKTEKNMGTKEETTEEFEEGIEIGKNVRDKEIVYTFVSEEGNTKKITDEEQQNESEPVESMQPKENKPTDEAARLNFPLDENVVGVEH